MTFGVFVLLISVPATDDGAEQQRDEEVVLPAVAGFCADKYKRLEYVLKYNHV